MEYTYLLINLAIIIVPLFFSFEKKIRFISHWKAFIPAISITGLIFIIWDIIFTDIGVWSFNKDYLTGIYIFNLPIEEILFFITVPYSCLFVFAVVDFYLPEKKKYDFLKIIYLVLSLFLLFFGFININRLYTSVTFISLSVVLVMTSYIFKFKKMRNFSITFILSLIPFLIFNGLLTSIPVVIYNNYENLGFRIFSIPFEDIFYGMLLILINVLIYTHFNKKIQK
ncbi:MAG: lycopene cyclase domain-containing protein [Candidatus Kapabacteria bacterium]|nr:lycopene cyclase domain-containing protein [Candidatus Kapabacteria bacterium]